MPCSRNYLLALGHARSWHALGQMDCMHCTAAGWAHVVIPGSRRRGDLGRHAARNLASRHGLQQSHTHNMGRLVLAVACCMSLPLHGGSKVQSSGEGWRRGLCLLFSEPTTTRKNTAPEYSGIMYLLVIITLAKEVVSATFATKRKKRTISPP